MPASIDNLRDQVERHFESLAHIRKNSDLPVFAIEHGLSNEDLDQIKSVLKSQCKGGILQPTDWLLWVIYATEVGYNYSGDEYWHSFEDKTPGWELHHRRKIKTWFRKFQKLYNGVEPSGLWAEHFTIIAWPITHAILPVYMQFQFARALYDLRFRLATMATLDPEKIGQLIAVNAHIPTTRFREFLEQEKLIGQIILAILGKELSEFNQPIYPNTLQRIVADLDRVNSSRKWLIETRRVVSDRFKGIGTGPWPRPNPGESGPGQVNTSHLSVRPKLMLRHSGSGNWSVLLDVPSFRSISTLNLEVRSHLERTRCRLNGGNDMKPKGWLLSGNRKGILQSWPDDTEPLIQLEHSNSVIDHLLESECRLSSGPIWLFRTNTDGTAREITGRTVRPGCDYIIVTTGELPEPYEGMSTCNLNCSGVNSFRYTVPDHVSSDMTSWLDKIGLQVARTIQVWPAGLPGRGWDGEGSSEWLTTESPCLGISHDHPVDAYTINLNNGPEVHVPTDDAEGPLFIRLAPLPVGNYNLIVKAHRNPSLENVATSPPAKGFAKLTVREPEPWTPGIASHPGLIITIDPDETDLDAFWKNDTRLSVIGPKDYTATLKLKLESKKNPNIFSGNVSTDTDLPITPEKWYSDFDQFLNQKNVDTHYLEASTCTLTIDGGTLGNREYIFEHVSRPLRWVVRRVRKNIFIRLVDDTDLEGIEPIVYRYNLELPTEKLSLTYDEVLSGIMVEPPGSLFIAEHAGYSDTIGISTIQAGTGFQGLGFHPHFEQLSRSTHALVNVLKLLENWKRARLSGAMIAMRHGKIIDGLHDALYKSICGPNWAETEVHYKNNPDSSQSLENLKSRVDRNSTVFVNALFEDIPGIVDNPIQRMSLFSQIATSHNHGLNSKHCEFSFRLATEPHILIDLYAEEIEGLLSHILDNPSILRGARLVQLLALSEGGKSSDFT